MSILRAKRTPSGRWNLLANYFGQAWLALSNILFIPIYISFLGMEAYGLVGIFAILTAAMTLIDAAVGPTVNRQMALVAGGSATTKVAGDLLRSLECICAVIAIVTVTCASAFAPTVASRWIGENSLPHATVAHALVLMATCAALRLTEGLYRGALLGMNRHVTLNFLSTLLATVRAIGAIAVLKWVSPTIETFFAWQAFASVLAIVLFGWRVYGALDSSERFDFRVDALVQIGRFAAGVLVTAAGGLLLTQADKILLSKALPLSTFGHYTLAVSVANALYQLVGPANQSYYPRFTALLATRDPVDLARLYHRACQIVSASVMPAAMTLHFGAESILLLWSHDTVLASAIAPILSVLAIGTMLHCLTSMPYMLQLAGGWSSLAAKANIVAACVFFPLLLWIVPIYGALGAAYVWIALNVGYILFSIPIMHTRLLRGELKTWYLRDIGGPLTACWFAGAIFNTTPPPASMAGHLARICGLAVLLFGTTIASTPYGLSLFSNIRLRPRSA